jgi:hypothetical protein
MLLAGAFAAAGLLPRRGAGVSGAAGHHCRALRARQFDRLRGAAGRPGPAEGARPAGHHRDPDRGDRRHRHAIRCPPRPDGYTILAGSSITLAANPGLFKALPYDPRPNSTPIAGVASTAMMSVTRANFPAKDMRAFLGHAAWSGDPVAVAALSCPAG